MTLGTRNYGILGLIIVLSLVSWGSAAEARSSYAGTFVTINRSMPMEEILASKETCEQCHQRVTPMVAAQHQDSAHFKAGISCAKCHGTDHKQMKIVTAVACEQCHQKQVEQTRNSKHAQSWKKSWNNSRYWSISEPMRRQGCERCHDIGYNFSDVRCDYCHTTHQFSAQEAKQPQACATCHMGPDHPQAEALAASKHANKVGCVDCHQVQGDHDVSKNMGIGGVSNGALLKDWDWAMDEQGQPKLKRPVITQTQFDQARQGNLAICVDCHDQGFSEQWLSGADQVKMAIEQMLIGAQEIVERLEQDGLLTPDPKNRPAIPGEGQKLVLGGNQLYVGTSKAEAIYFKMYKFAAAQGWKSAYHQDFQRAGTKGIQEMQSLMAQLEEEDRVLRSLSDNSVDTPPSSAQRNSLWTPIWVLLGLVGGLLGSGLALYLRQRQKRAQGQSQGSGVLPLVILFGLLATMGVSAPAQAWDKSGNANPQQCGQCHAAEQQQLKSGDHRQLACLDCHRVNAKKEQVRAPETCGKCHNSAMGEELEIYLTSPHGGQYQIKGQNPWVPVCATCHMPGAAHNMRTSIANSKGEYNQQIGEVCRQCHTTDHVDKFAQDLRAIQGENQQLVQRLKAVGLELVDRGVIRPASVRVWDGPEEYRQQWGKEGQWQLVNQDKLEPEEQAMAIKLVNNLIATTQQGLGRDAKVMRVGVAHVNPDYTHWYGNAYMNLAISEAEGTARSLTALAAKRGLSAKENPLIPGLVIVGSMVLGFVGARLILAKR